LAGPCSEPKVHVRSVTGWCSVKTFHYKNVFQHLSGACIPNKETSVFEEIGLNAIMQLSIFDNNIWKQPKILALSWYLYNIVHEIYMKKNVYAIM